MSIVHLNPVAAQQRQARLFWTDSAGYRAPTLRDREGNLLHPFVAYLDAFVEDLRKKKSPTKASQSQIEATTYALFGFANFLLRERAKLYRVDDDILRRYRDDAYQAVIANPKSRGNSHQAHVTVNVKLRRVYDFIYSCQKRRLLPKKILGWQDCQIQSSLPESETRGGDSDRSDRRKYPLCYQGVGEESRLHDGQHWATVEEIGEIEDFFWKQDSAFAAERNVLMLRLAEIEGWRIESVNSLLLGQFSDEACKRYAKNDCFAVGPPRQKLGRQHTFDMPWELAEHIRTYIGGSRKELLKSLGVTEDIAHERVFVSVRTGAPLTDRSCTEIFSTAFKAVGAPKGAGAHALRRYKSQLTAEEEIRFRLENKLSVAKEDVEKVVMETLGHGSREAQRAYHRAVGRRKKTSPEVVLRARVDASALEKDRLRGELRLVQDRVHELENSLKAAVAVRKSRRK